MKKLIIAISLLITSLAYADNHKYNFWWEQIPAICVDDKSLWGYAKSKDLQPLNVSYGRVNGKEDGEVVYIVTYWVNVHENQSMASVKTPKSEYSCILFRTFDLQLNPGFDFNPKVDT